MFITNYNVSYCKYTLKENMFNALYSKKPIQIPNTTNAFIQQMCSTRLIVYA